MRCSSAGVDVGHSPRNVRFPVRMFQKNSASPSTRIPPRPLSHQSTDFWNAWFHFLSTITPTYSEANLTQLTKTRCNSHRFQPTCQVYTVDGFTSSCCDILCLSACVPDRLKKNTFEMLGVHYRMSNGPGVLDDINPHGHQLHGSLPALSLRNTDHRSVISILPVSVKGNHPAITHSCYHIFTHIVLMHSYMHS